MTKGIDVKRCVTLCAMVIAAGTLACESTKPPVPEPSKPRSEFDDGSSLPPKTSMPAATLETVYFDFDRANIRPDMQAILRTDASTIKSEPTWRNVTLEGNTDERGSEEYNLALGDRRAMAVKRYLVDLGIPSSKLDTVSFGETKPAVMGHDESAWRYNRRVDFVVNQ